MNQVKYYKQAAPIDNGVTTIKNLIKLLQINVTNDAIESVKYSKDYPSLGSIIGALKEWNLKTLAVRIPPEQLQNIPLPAICLLKTETGDQYAVLNEIDTTSVSFVDCERGSTVKVLLEEFINKWTGVVLAIETNKNSGEDDYEVKVKRKASIAKLNFIVILIAVVLFVISLIIVTSNFIQLIPLKILGLFISFLLLRSWLGTSGSIIDSICKVNKNFDCKNVISSRDSMVLGFHLSEISMLYYSGGWLSVILMSLDLAKTPSAFLYLNVIALPITLITLYLQIFKLKKLCTLCITLTLTIWAELILIAFSISDFSLTGRTVLLVSFGYLIPIMTWIGVRKSLFDSFKVGKLTKMLSDFTRDKHVFKHLFSSQKKIFLTDGIIFGNTQSDFCITAIISPNCPPCALAFKNLVKIKESFGDRIKVNILFKVDQKNDEMYKMVLHTLELFKIDASMTWRSLMAWYFDGYDQNITKWISKYPLSLTNDETVIEAKDNFEKQIQFINQRLVIEATPTVYINGKKYPVKFGLSNLLFHLSFLLEEESQVENV